ncbi:MAG: DNA/RNA nuclease SfsA [Nitrososphaeria archaeon]
MKVYEFNEKVWEATVIKRLNRFLVEIKDNNGKYLCHLHDPGRLEELIYNGSRVLVRSTLGLKTKCSITAANNSGRWVIVDSRVHNIIAKKFLPESARPEVKVGNCRLDFKYNSTFVEVKGCTLVRNGVALFPDAPTERGKRHMLKLAELAKNGKNGVLMMLVMRDDAKCFYPNFKTDPAFSKAFFNAINSGVNVIIKSFKFDGKKVEYVEDLSVCANHQEYF